MVDAVESDYDSDSDFSEEELLPPPPPSHIELLRGKCIKNVVQWLDPQSRKSASLSSRFLRNSCESMVQEFTADLEARNGSSAEMVEQGWKVIESGANSTPDSVSDVTHPSFSDDPTSRSNDTDAKEFVTKSRDIPSTSERSVRGLHFISDIGDAVLLEQTQCHPRNNFAGDEAGGANRSQGIQKHETSRRNLTNSCELNAVRKYERNEEENDLASDSKRRVRNDDCDSTNANSCSPYHDGSGTSSDSDLDDVSLLSKPSNVPLEDDPAKTPLSNFLASNHETPFDETSSTSTASTFKTESTDRQRNNRVLSVGVPPTGQAQTMPTLQEEETKVAIEENDIIDALIELGDMAIFDTPRLLFDFMNDVVSRMKNVPAKEKNNLRLTRENSIDDQGPIKIGDKFYSQEEAVILWRKVRERIGRSSEDCTAISSPRPLQTCSYNLGSSTDLSNITSSETKINDNDLNSTRRAESDVAIQELFMRLSISEQYVSDHYEVKHDIMATSGRSATDRGTEGSKLNLAGGNQANGERNDSKNSHNYDHHRFQNKPNPPTIAHNRSFDEAISASKALIDDAETLDDVDNVSHLSDSVLGSTYGVEVSSLRGPSCNSINKNGLECNNTHRFGKKEGESVLGSQYGTEVLFNPEKVVRRRKPRTLSTHNMNVTVSSKPPGNMATLTPMTKKTKSQKIMSIPLKMRPMRLGIKKSNKS